jgi:trehalose 6-phosphate synthase
MILVTHRGPYRFSRTDDGRFVAHRGAGGLVTALLPLVEGGGEERRAWIAAAMGEADRGAVESGQGQVADLELDLLALDPTAHRMHYDVVSNGVLWFLHHGLFDLGRRPRFDAHFRTAWDAYVDVNRAFADAIVRRANAGEAVLVHDYHLALVPGMVRAQRPDVRLAHFTHTPFCGPNSIRVLPDAAAQSLCASMAAAPTGFHTQRWADAFRASAATVLGAQAPIAPSFVAPLGPDPDALHAAADSPGAAAAEAQIDRLVGNRSLVLRSDRIDPAKNIVRGFLAYDRMLELHPEWHARVVFVALLNRSREGLAEYLAYELEITEAADAVNRRHATPQWQPVVVDTRDNYEQTVAAYHRYDVLVVNSLRDGLNLVAKEGPLVNRREGVLVLSPEAGSFAELGNDALPIHPYDVEQGAEVLHHALTLDPAERARRALRLRDASAANTPATWLRELLAHVA